MTRTLKVALRGAIACLVAAVATADAADLPVSYKVDMKTLKNDAPAGTMLLFELFDENTCGATPVASDSIAVEQLQIELLKLLKPSGAEAPPPKLAVLRTVLAGLSEVPATPYLKVTGDGVLTLQDGPCQPQPTSGVPAGNVAGSGTANTITMWTGGSGLGNSSLTDDGVTVATGERFRSDSGLCLGVDCRATWNGQDANSVSPLPRNCPAGRVAVSTGAYSWTCDTVCSYGTDDCNNSGNDGCELNVAVDPNNCGGCAVVCSGNNISSRTCSNGNCNGTCMPGSYDCNANKQTDGCESLSPCP